MFDQLHHRGASEPHQVPTCLSSWRWWKLPCWQPSHCIWWVGNESIAQLDDLCHWYFYIWISVMIIYISLLSRQRNIAQQCASGECAWFLTTPMDFLPFFQGGDRLESMYQTHSKRQRCVLRFRYHKNNLQDIYLPSVLKKCCPAF